MKTPAAGGTPIKQGSTPNVNAPNVGATTSPRKLNINAPPRTPTNRSNKSLLDIAEEGDEDSPGQPKKQASNKRKN